MQHNNNNSNNNNLLWTKTGHFRDVFLGRSFDSVPVSETKLNITRSDNTGTKRLLQENAHEAKRINITRTPSHKLRELLISVCVALCTAVVHEQHGAERDQAQCTNRHLAGATIKTTPLEINHDLWCYKTRVRGLLCGVFS